MSRLLLLAFLLVAPSARAACPGMVETAFFVQALLERRAPQPFRGLSIADARCAQDRLVAYLAQPWGDVVGYAVVESPAGPLRGALFHGTLREHARATLDAQYGARPALAPALLLRIGRDGVESAGANRAAIAAYVDATIPFLALLDLAAIPNGTDVATRVAGNLGIRLGVRGEPMDLSPDDLVRLNAIPARLDLGSATGARAVELRGLGLAGHPLDLLAALARERAAEGWGLRAGEQVAVIGPVVPYRPVAGDTVRFTVLVPVMATELGSVTVTFR